MALYHCLSLPIIPERERRRRLAELRQTGGVLREQFRIIPWVDNISLGVFQQQSHTYNASNYEITCLGRVVGIFAFVLPRASCAQKGCL